MMVEYEHKPQPISKNYLSISAGMTTFQEDPNFNVSQDGVPSIDKSVTLRSPNNQTQTRIMSTSKFLLNDPEEDADDRLSNITDIVCDDDETKFKQLYN